MKVDVDGKPLVGKRRNMLGVRPFDPNNKDPRRKFDVAAVNGGDPVLPGTKRGLSVSETTAKLVPASNEAIWEIDSDDLLPYLRPVPDRPPHNVIEPMAPMTLDEYQAALIATRDSWVRIP
jgi:hypothetical protein